MRTLSLALLAPVLLYAEVANAQSGYIAPDGKNRYPGVTIFCPDGTGVTPCDFGSGATGGDVTVSLGGNPVGTGNPFPVEDSLLEGLISGGALKVGGSVSISGTPSVALAGAPSVSLTGALPAGSNAIGSVGINNFPASQTINGSVAVSSLPALPTGSNTIGSVGVSNFPSSQTINGSVAVSALPALPAGSNAIGTVGLASGSVGSVTAAGTSGTVAQAVQGVAGGVAMPVSGSFWQATQPVSVAILPLPTGAAADSDLVAPYASIAPATATATKSLIIGCLANTTLPSFTAGQEGAVPCDTSGRPYVVTVPSANNVPGYLQAVSSGGATPSSAVNAAASCMATSVKASSGMVFGYSVSNTNSGGVWFRLFASASAPTCGSGTPLKRIYVPAGATIALSTDLGWVFSGGIGYDVTAGSGADTDTTTVATANSVLVDVDYK